MEPESTYLSRMHLQETQLDFIILSFYYYFMSASYQRSSI